MSPQCRSWRNPFSAIPRPVPYPFVPSPHHHRRPFASPSSLFPHPFLSKFFVQFIFGIMIIFLVGFTLPYSRSGHKILQYDFVYMIKYSNFLLRMFLRKDWTTNNYHTQLYSILFQEIVVMTWINVYCIELYNFVNLKVIYLPRL